MRRTSIQNTHTAKRKWLRDFLFLLGPVFVMENGKKTECQELRYDFMQDISLCTNYTLYSLNNKWTFLNQPKMCHTIINALQQEMRFCLRHEVIDNSCLKQWKLVTLLHICNQPMLKCSHTRSLIIFVEVVFKQRVNSCSPIQIRNATQTFTLKGRFVLLHYRRNTIRQMIRVDEDGKTSRPIQKVSSIQKRSDFRSHFLFFFLNHKSYKFETVQHSLWILIGILCVFGIESYSNTRTHQHIHPCVYIHAVSKWDLFCTLSDNCTLQYCWWDCAFGGCAVFVSSSTPMMMFAVVCQT